MGATLLDKVILEVDGRVDRAQAALKAVSGDLDDFGARVARVNGGAGGLDGVIGSVSGRLGGLAGALTSPASAATILTAALGGLAIEAVQTAAALDEPLRRVANLLPNEPPEGIAALRTGLVELSHDSGIAEGELAGLYETIAKGGAGSAAGVEAMARAAVALRDAYGGDLLAHAQGLDTVLDAFGLKAEAAGAAAATLYRAATQAGAPLEEMYAVLAKIAPVAVANGLTFEQVALKIAQLNAQGTPLKATVKVIEDLAAKGALTASAFADVERVLGPVAEREAALARESDAARNSTERLQATLKNEFALVLVSIGGQIGRFINGPLRDLRLALTQGVAGDVARARAAIDAAAGRSGAKDQTYAARDLAKSLAGDPAAARALGAASRDDLAHARAVLEGYAGRGFSQVEQLVGVADDAEGALRNVRNELAALDRQQAAPPSLQNTTVVQLGAQLRALKQQLADADTPAKLRALRAELAALQQRAQTSGSDLLLSGTTDALAKLDQQLDKTDAKAQGAADRAERRAEQQRQKRTNVLQAFDAAIARETPGQSDNLDAEVAHLRAAAEQAKAGLAGAALATFERSIEDAVARLRAGAAAKGRAAGDAVVDEVRAQLVQGVTNAARQAELALQEFDRKIAEARKRGATFGPDGEAQIAAARAARAEAARIARESERISGTLETLQANSDNGAAAIATMRELLALRDRERAQLEGVDAFGRRIAVSDEQRKASKQRLLEIDRQIAQLEGRGAEVARIAAENAAKIETTSERLAGGLKNAASAAAGVVTVFQGANSELAHMLVSIAGVSGGIEDLLKAGRAAGGLGGLFSSAAGLAKAAGPLGAIIAGGASLVTSLGGALGFGESPAEKADREQRAKLQAENTQAIRDLTTKLGGTDLAKTSARQSAAVQVAKDILAQTERGGAYYNRRGDVVTQQVLNAALRRNGITSFGEFQQAAKELGITVDQYRDTRDNDPLKALIQAAGTSGAQFGALQDRLDVAGASASERLRAFLDALSKTAETATSKGATLAKAILRQFDLTTGDGRKAAQAYVRDQFATNKAISADLAKQLLGLIDGAASEADANAGANAAAAGHQTATEVARGAASLTEATGLSMADLLRGTATEVHALRYEVRDRLDALLAAAGALPVARVAPPVLPGYGAPVLREAGAAESGRPTLQVSIGSVSVAAPAGVDPVAHGAAVGRGIADGVGAALGELLGDPAQVARLNGALGRQLQVDRLVLGDLTVRPAVAPRSTRAPLAGARARATR